MSNSDEIRLSMIEQEREKTFNSRFFIFYKRYSENRIKFVKEIFKGMNEPQYNIL